MGGDLFDALEDERHSSDQGAHVIDAEERFSDWRRKLILNADKTPKACVANALTALRHAPQWRDVLAYDEFHHNTLLRGAPPWRAGTAWTPRTWSDSDDTAAAEWMQRSGIFVNEPTVANAVKKVAEERSFHPVREYLAGLRWDGNERLEQTMLEVFGCDDTPYTRAALRCFLIASIARVMQPGCKADNVLILEGQQGARKSTACSVLFGRFFTDDMADLGTKDAGMQVRGAWGIELPELSAMNRSDIERVKAFITRRVDRFRPSYGRHVIEAPRECVFIGTTNADHYLKDETGARRFWPIRCGAINIDLLVQNRDLIWAEARELYNAGEPWWLIGDDVLKLAGHEQDQRYEADPWEATILEALVAKSETSAEELLTSVLHIEKGRQNRQNLSRIGRILRRDGWQQRRLRQGQSRRRVYVRGLAP